MRAGDLTNHGFIQWIDELSPLILDPLVKTTKGVYRLSELEPVMKEQYFIKGTWFDKLYFGRDIVEKTRIVPVKQNS